MKYKVGDKVKIHTLEWFELNCKKNIINNFYLEESNNFYFTTYMQNNCGKVIEIKKINEDLKSYCLKNDTYNLNYQDWMFEDRKDENRLQFSLDFFKKSEICSFKDIILTTAKNKIKDLNYKFSKNFKYNEIWYLNKYGFVTNKKIEGEEYKELAIEDFYDLRKFNTFKKETKFIVDFSWITGTAKDIILDTVRYHYEHNYEFFIETRKNTFIKKPSYSINFKNYNYVLIDVEKESFTFLKKWEEYPEVKCNAFLEGKF